MDIRFKEVVENLLVPLRYVGLDKLSLWSYYNRSSLSKKLNEIDTQIRKFEVRNDDIKGDIIIPYTHSQGETDHLLGILAHAFRVRGYRPFMLSCRGTLPLCLRKQNHPDNRSACIACKYRSDEVLNSYGIKKVKLHRYNNNIREDILPERSNKLSIMKYKNVDVGNLATASARRHLRKYSIDLDNESEENIFRRYIMSAIKLVEFSYSLIKEKNVKAVVGNHPAYVYGGAVLRAAQQCGLPAISYGGGYFRKDALLFGNIKNRKGFEMFSDHDTAIEKVKRPLTETEENEVEHYMRGRRRGDTVRSANQYVQSAERGLNIYNDSTSVGMFTNLLWDGSLSGSSVTFNNPFEWVEETMKFLHGKNNIHLILKPHPAEHHRETKIYMAEWIRDELNVPDNVTILDASTNVSPYELFTDIDAAIVFNSTVGMEAAYDGVPVITTGDTHYKNLGFTYDPVTPHDYFGLLKKPGKLSISEEQIKRAKRYAHFLLVERHISFDELKSISSIHQLSHSYIENNETFDSIIEQILNDSKSISYN
jgi:hypothetical protein